MTALATDKARVRIGEPIYVGSIPAAASTTTYLGSLVTYVTGTGYGRPGATATTHVAVGVSTKKVDNSSGANGDKTIPYETGVFEFENSSAADAIAQADMGADCYVVDDNTVAKTNGTSTRSVAGKVMGLRNGKVLVAVGLVR